MPLPGHRGCFLILLMRVLAALADSTCWEPSHPITPPTAGHFSILSSSFPGHFSILSALQQHLRGMQAGVQEPRQTIPSHRSLFLSPKPLHSHGCLRMEQSWLELNTAPFYCDKLPSPGCESVTICTISSLPSLPCLTQELFILRL